MSSDPPPEAAGAAAPRASFMVRVVWVLWIVGYLIGTSTHVAELVAGGAQTYAGFPMGLRVFWMSLTVLDPLIVVLLLFRHRAGIILGVAVILIDIAVNWTVYATIGGNPLFGVINQTLFAILIVTTAHLLWRWFTASARGGRAPAAARR
ncbi:hypothetical protein LQ757_11125 [Agromyces sp. SYSU K20354]|uniref:hypothetical protein n=1 Tax=Agromyces cavernae TaxID=2898659 RepID=UPI001E3834F1|nr:hypothetical protein [Agromyces cavernae]MCD2442825.1 hypothetical protein [Agromyces cavernae]